MYTIFYACIVLIIPHNQKKLQYPFVAYSTFHHLIFPKLIKYNIYIIILQNNIGYALNIQILINWFDLLIQMNGRYRFWIDFIINNNNNKFVLNILAKRKGIIAKMKTQNIQPSQSRRTVKLQPCLSSTASKYSTFLLD